MFLTLSTSIQKAVDLMNKPPLGLMPKSIYEAQIMLERMNMIVDAMKRYAAVQKPIPVEWIEELEELMKGGW